MSDTLITFVGARQGNAFINELLAAAAQEASASGARTEMLFDAFPDNGRRAYVFVPHEFYGCVVDANHPTPRQLARTIAFCTEQPGTTWFDESAKRAATAGAVFDINAVGRDQLRRRGLRAELFRLGYTEFWDRWHGDDDSERPIDVLHLGSTNPRRCRLLASYAQTLWPRRTRILLPPEAPKSGARADFLLADEKWGLLRSSRLLLNIHRQRARYFEWARALEAIANGCVIVSEPAIDHAPLVPGEHFVSGRPESLGLLADRLLDDEHQLRGMRRAAYDLVREELPMRPSAVRLAEVAEQISGRRRARRAAGRPHPWRAATAPLRRAGNRAVDRAFRAAIDRAVEDPEIEPLVSATLATEQRLEKATAALKRLALEGIETRRLLRQHIAGAIDPAPVLLAETPAYSSAVPRVSVFVPLYNYADHVPAALASAAASDFRELELVVLDDASTDDSAQVVQAFLAAHASLPAVLLHSPLNRGLGRTRNELVQRSRGEYVFSLDADNEIYPTALSRLVEALDADPQATFAYSMLEEHMGGDSIGLRSSLPWEPLRMFDGNYIDAMSLLRRGHVLELGGYSEDLRLYGWEDYELWLRVAAAGRYGVLVPEILCRYRRSSSSMLAVTDIDDAEVRALLGRRYPRPA